jgi:hypothetical protein
VVYKVSDPLKTTGKILVLCIFVIMCLKTRWKIKHSEIHGITP